MRSGATLATFFENAFVSRVKRRVSCGQLIAVASGSTRALRSERISTDIPAPDGRGVLCSLPMQKTQSSLRLAGPSLASAKCLAGLAVLLVLFACNNEGAKGTAAAPSASAPNAGASALEASVSTAPTAAPSATASAPQAPLPKCAPGLTGNAVPAFCIKLPSGYAPKDTRTAPTHGSIAYATGTETDSLIVSYDEASIASQSKDVEGEMKFGGDKLDKKGDLPGGNKWFQGTHQDYARIVTLVKGPGSLTLKCSFTYKPKSAPAKEAIDACKSIVAPAAP